MSADAAIVPDTTQQLKGCQLRTLASPETPRASTTAGVTFAVGDYLLFYCGAATAILAPWWTLKVAGVLISGIAAAMLFALAHDAAHGSLAGSRIMNRLLAMLPAVLVPVHPVDSRPQSSPSRMDQRGRVRLFVAARVAG